MGLGKECKETKIFTKLTYDSKAVQFVDADIFDDHAVAID